MRRSLIALSALSLLAACGPKPEGKETTPDANPSATILTPANEASTPEFVEKATLADMFEIEAAKIALDRSTNAEVKAFAKMMSDAHTKTSADLKAAIAASGQSLTPPTALNEDLNGKLAALKQVDVKDFDEAYMDGQISTHQDTLNRMTRYAIDGGFGPIKTFAVDTKDGVQAHLDSAQSVERGLKK
jgi:putative membrane protein